MGEIEAFYKKGCHPAYDYDRCLKQIENVLCFWKRSDKQHSPNEVAKFEFAYHKFSLTRYSISDNAIEKDSNSETTIPKSQRKGNNTFNQHKEMPKAWLDMLDNSNFVRRHDAHYFHRCYGLKEFIVVEMYPASNHYFLRQSQEILVNLFSFLAIKCKCQLPLFVYCNSALAINPGILEYPGFRTSFRAWDTILPLDYEILSLIDMIVGFQNYVMRWRFPDPLKFSMTFTYYSNRKLSHYQGFTSLTNVMVEDYEEYPKIEFYLSANWSDILYSEGCEDKLGLNPLGAPKWSFRVNVEDTPEVSLGDCLKSFLSLCSSQTESFLLNPEIFSMLKYRRLYKQTEGGFKLEKITSKLTLKHEESLIPVDSLNVILDFLFHDAKLQPSQHSNRTTAIVEDEVGDKFYQSYKELSKYFKSTRPSSLMSRLAICLFIVNKYHGGLGAVNQLWGEFVLEMKYCLENNYEIKGLELVEPKLDYRELLQKLQMLNRCISRARDAASPITDITTNNINNFIFNEDFVDISELPLEKNGSLSEARSRVGSWTSESYLRMEMLVNRVSAKDAFYAANPGCAFGDFVRWCSDEDWMEKLDEGKDKITNKNHHGHLNQRIKISDEVSLVFHKSEIQRRLPKDDAAAKVLHWLALVKPSDLVLKLMTILLFSAVTKLLEHPVCRLGFLREHFVQYRKKLIDQFHNKVPRCTSSTRIKMLEELVQHLALIEQKMSRAQYLLDAFRYVDPSITVGDAELEKYVSHLVDFKEIPIDTPRGELPSNTSFGKLIYKLFHDHEGTTGEWVAKESDTEAPKVKVNVEPKFREYVLLIDCSKTTGSCIRLHANGCRNRYKVSAAYTNISSEKWPLC